MTDVWRHYHYLSPVQYGFTFSDIHRSINPTDAFLWNAERVRHFLPSTNLVRGKGLERIEDQDTATLLQKALVERKGPKHQAFARCCTCGYDDIFTAPERCKRFGLVGPQSTRPILFFSLSMQVKAQARVEEKSRDIPVA